MIIALTGPSGSGKSAIEKVLSEEYGFRKVISYTTRHPRANEENHKDYHFISKKEFQKKIDEGSFAEWDCYSGERFYGSDAMSYKTEFNIVCVLTPYGIRQLKAKGIDVKVVYVTADLSIRVKRYMDRISEFDISDLQEIYARSERDFGMFKGMNNEADVVIVNNGDKTVKELVVDLLFKKLSGNSFPESKEKEIKTLYIDFDNTLVKTTECIVQLYNDDFQFYENYKKIDPKDVSYGFKECNCASEKIITQYFNSPRFFDNIDFMPGAYNALKMLRGKYKICVVSMGESPNLKGKEKWLKVQLPFVKFIGCDLNEYQDKSHIDMSDGIMIDDTAKMLETSNARRKILFGTNKNDWEYILEGLYHE